MSGLLKDLMKLIEEHDVLSGIWDKLCLPSPVVAWMDDVAFPISTLEASQLDNALERLLPQIRNIFEAYGLRLNLAKGKTEVVCQYRGAGSSACREFRFIECLGAFRVADLSWTAVSAYEHLGTMFAQSVTIQSELRIRAGKATSAFFVKCPRTFSPTDTFQLPRDCSYLSPWYYLYLFFCMVVATGLCWQKGNSESLTI